MRLKGQLHTWWGSVKDQADLASTVVVNSILGMSDDGLFSMPLVYGSGLFLWGRPFGAAGGESPEGLDSGSEGGVGKVSG